MIIDWSNLQTAEQVQQKERQKQIDIANYLVRDEATRRINQRWNAAGQANVALGLYSDEQRQDCIDWINSHRDAANSLIARSDLLEIDVSANEHWPALE
jgi:hypothetical protein